LKGFAGERESSGQGGKVILLNNSQQRECKLRKEGGVTLSPISHSSWRPEEIFEPCLRHEAGKEFSTRSWLGEGSGTEA